MILADVEALAAAGESETLERLHGQHRWENEPATDWAVDDLDPSEITRTIDDAIRRRRAEEPGTRDPAELLRGFGLIHGGRLLRAAVVLFGRPERVGAEYPQCMLRVARFDGIARTDEFLDNRQVYGNAFTLLSRAERFFLASLPIAGRIEPGRFERVDDPLYPPDALREALANAICHRDYSIGGGSVAAAIYYDRLEVTSSGPLHFGLTPEGLFEPHESLPWNPLIARVFYLRGIIEQWGRGTIKMRELITNAGAGDRRRRRLRDRAFQAGNLLAHARREEGERSPAGHSRPARRSARRSLLTRDHPATE